MNSIIITGLLRLGGISFGCYKYSPVKLNATQTDCFTAFTMTASGHSPAKNDDTKQIKSKDLWYLVDAEKGHQLPNLLAIFMKI